MALRTGADSRAAHSKRVADAGGAPRGLKPSAEPRHVRTACLTVFAAVWLALAIAPVYRADWLLENLLTFAAVPAWLWAARRVRISDRAWIQATAFVLLHTVGSHYTYSEVPIGFWARDALGLTRNHFDRLVHFAFGLLMLRPARELLAGPRDAARPFAMAYLDVGAVLLWSALYEILEAVVARVADPAAGTAYLGTQGDIWDAQKDMACAALGALLAAVIEATADRRAARTRSCER